MYSIKAIAALTGLGAETLRAWERRYQAIIPKRDDSGRPSYSSEDLEKLMLLANLTRQGHSISKIAGLAVTELHQLSNTEQGVTDSLAQFIDQIAEALLDYRLDRCEQLLKRGLLIHEPLAYVRDILTPVLCQIGQLWHDEKLSIAQEHLFSGCVKRILLGMVNNVYNLSSNRRNILFATPQGEPHEFGILMCCLLAAEQQYNCYYLGTDVPAADLLEAAGKLKCELIVLSLLKSPPSPETLSDLDYLANAAIPKIDIWLGGSGAVFWHEQQQTLPKNCEIIVDIDSFYLKAQRRQHEK